MIIMLKIILNSIEVGQTFSIRNSWRKAVAMLLKKEDYPSNFKVVEIVTNDNKEQICVCESVPNDTCKKVVKLNISKLTLQYVLGQEVEDCNVGLYFNDYMPLEGQKLLVTDSKDNLKITPCQLLLDVQLDQKVPVVQFVLKHLLDASILSISSQTKNPWKLLSGSDVYMTDVEKMYQDTFIHKGYVIVVCNKFADYLEKEGQMEDAEDLRQRAIVHDNSKILNKNEFQALTSIINDKSCLRDANSRLSSFKQDAIELHWENNEHHPEHYENINDMPLRARREFVCDCCARSVQYGTDLISFMETRLNDRFHFSELVKDEILHDCKIVVELMKA
jgi:hypothetical protein